MKATVTATELKNRLGKYLLKAVKEPVLISKSGDVRFVLMSHETYAEIKKAERLYLGRNNKD